MLSNSAYKCKSSILYTSYDNNSEIALAINNGLMEDHSMTLYSKGTQNPKGCQAVPETCNILSKMTSAETCKRGEVSEFKPLL
jgi:hypothetical protein